MIFEWNSPVPIRQQLETHLLRFEELNQGTKQHVLAMLEAMEEAGFFKQIRSHLYWAMYRKAN